MPSWGHPYLTLNQPAIAPAGRERADDGVLPPPGARLGLTEPYLLTSDEQIIRDALDSDDPWLEGITWERLLEEGWAKLAIPEPWVPYAEGDFPTPSGKAEFFLGAPGRGRDRSPAALHAGCETPGR